jgi:hypothetical protein
MVSKRIFAEPPFIAVSTSSIIDAAAGIAHPEHWSAILANKR